MRDYCFADKTQPLSGTYPSKTPARIGLTLACRVGWSQSGSGKPVPDALSAWGCSTYQCGAPACWSHEAPWTYKYPQHSGNLQRHINEKRGKKSVCWNVNIGINIIRGPALPFPREGAPCNRNMLDLSEAYMLLAEKRFMGKHFSVYRHFHRVQKASCAWWEQPQKEHVAYWKLNDLKESLDSSFNWHWFSASQGLAVTSLPEQSAGLWWLRLRVSLLADPHL